MTMHSGKARLKAKPHDPSHFPTICSSDEAICVGNVGLTFALYRWKQVCGKVSTLIVGGASKFNRARVDLANEPGVSETSDPDN